MNLEQVKKDIESWIVNFVEVPHPALGGFPPCPYARKARLNNSYDVQLGTDLLEDLSTVASNGLGGKEVLVLVYNRTQYTHEEFANTLDQANQQILLPHDFLALEDHPDDLEIVNGVCMNQGTYALALIQSLSDLNDKAGLMAKKGFYDAWPEDYLQMLFANRQDPRK
jgi:hypothetical protein